MNTATLLFLILFQWKTKKNNKVFRSHHIIVQSMQLFVFGDQHAQAAWYYQHVQLNLQDHMESRGRENRVHDEAECKHARHYRLIDISIKQHYRPSALVLPDFLHRDRENARLANLSRPMQWTGGYLCCHGWSCIVFGVIHAPNIQLSHISSSTRLL